MEIFFFSSLGMLSIHPKFEKLVWLVTCCAPEAGACVPWQQPSTLNIHLACVYVSVNSDIEL